MKILFNGMCITGNMSGVQNYAYNLMSHGILNHEDFKAVMPAALRDMISDGGMGNGITFIDNVNRLGRILFEHTAMNRLTGDYTSAVLHCPAYILPFNYKGRSVVTVHDTIALDNPEYCKNSNAAYFNLLLKRSIRNATHIISVSHSVKNDILRHCDVDPEKISVVYHGIDDIYHDPAFNGNENALSGLRLPENYILFVGNIEPKKNLERLIEAYALLLSRKEDHGHKLVIAGQWGWKFGKVKDIVRKYRLQDHVIFLGYVEKRFLPYLYSKASLFLFPSICEGFGLPPLEAMACGTPVLFSSAGAVMEVTSGIGFMVDPSSVDDIANGISEGLGDSASRAEYIRLGREHSMEFTWKKCWDETLKVYRYIS